ncbi:MAG: calcium-binding protein [Chloroflexi bacterium]|nr:calcium-binding protein [Chloroflexota bacterium]
MTGTVTVQLNTSATDYASAPIDLAVDGITASLASATNTEAVTITSFNATLRGVSLSADSISIIRTTNAANEKILKIGASNITLSIAADDGVAMSLTIADAALFVTPRGVAAQLTSAPFSYSHERFRISDLTASIAINNTTAPIDETIFTGPGNPPVVLDMPAGPYLRVTISGTVSIGPEGDSFDMSGTFQFEQLTRPGPAAGTTQKILRIGASGVSVSIGEQNLSDGQGALIIYSDGVAATVSGTVDVGFGGFSAGGAIVFDLSTTPRAVDESMDVDGQAILIKSAAGTRSFRALNAAIQFGDYVRISGDFAALTESVSVIPAGGPQTTESASIYAVRNASIFLGDGVNPDRTLTADAIGLRVKNADLAVVKFGDGTFALVASGAAEFVGLDGIAVSGTIGVRINNSNRAVLNEQVNFPTGDPITLNFPGAAVIEVFDGAMYLAIGSALSVQGTARFTRRSNRVVYVDILNAAVAVVVDGEELFALGGSASFTLGGAEGFKLQELRMSGFSLAGVSFGNLAAPAVARPAAELISPATDGITGTGTTYIDVEFSDPNGFGPDEASILGLGDGAEFTLLQNNATLAGVSVSDNPTKNSGNVYRYVITGGLGLDQMFGRSEPDTFVWAKGDDADTSISGEGGADKLVVTAGANSENITVLHEANTNLKVRWNSETLTLTGANVESLELDLGKGADTVTIEDLKGSIITGVHLNLGRRDLSSGESLSSPSVNNAADGADDTVIIKGTSSSSYNDSVVVDVFQLPAGNSPTGDATSAEFIGSGEYWSRYRRVGLYQVTISNSDRNQGDDLTVETFQGADNINASGFVVNKLALTLKSGAGRDIVIGSPYNDVIDSGTGSDTVTGGPGVDVFLDASGSADTDTLVELLNRDMSLFNNYFVSGKILADNGGTFFKADHIVEQGTAPADAMFPAPIVNPLTDRADVYRSSDAEIESLLNAAGLPIFERASLQGGTANNVMVLGDRDNVTGNRTTNATYTNASGQVKNNFPSLVEVNRQRKVIANDVVIGTTTGSGTDTLNLRNENDGTARTTTLSAVLANSVTLHTVTSTAMAGSIRYQGLDSVVVRLGGGADTISLDHTHAGSTTLYGNGGNDTFNVNRILGATALHGGSANDTILVSGTSSGILDTVHGLGAELTVNGDGGTDVLTLNDTGDGSGDTDGILTGTRLTGLGMAAGLTYGGIETLNVNLGLGHDAFRVDGTHVAATFIRGGDGNDTVHLGGDPPLLEFDPPPITVQTPGFQVTKTITEVRTVLTRPAPITYNNISFFALFDLNALAAVLGGEIVNIVLNFVTLFWGFRFPISARVTVQPPDVITTKTVTRTETVTIQPPAMEVDPPPFWMKVDAVHNVTGLRGKLTINGGDTVDAATQTPHYDQVIIHNEDGAPIPGSIELTTVNLHELMRRPVLDQDGQPVTQFVQIFDNNGLPVLDEHGKPTYRIEPVLETVQVPVLDANATRSCGWTHRANGCPPVGPFTRTSWMKTASPRPASSSTSAAWAWAPVSSWMARPTTASNLSSAAQPAMRPMGQP